MIAIAKVGDVVQVRVDLSTVAQMSEEYTFVTRVPVVLFLSNKDSVTYNSHPEIWG